MSRRRPISGNRSRLSYAEVGATLGELPAGYHQLERARLIGHGRELFERAGAQVLGWAVQTGAGLRVRSDRQSAAPDVLLEVGLGVGPLRVWFPCLVVDVTVSEERIGFSYGTLPGHAEIGEEAFGVRIDEQDQVWLEIRAFSRPGPWWARALGPVGRLVQRRVTERYLHALDT